MFQILIFLLIRYMCLLTFKSIVNSSITGFLENGNYKSIVVTAL